VNIITIPGLKFPIAEIVGQNTANEIQALTEA
jgi:hypothetical protein